MSYDHVHEHGHSHTHEHAGDHTHEALTDPARQQALLAYMLDHNSHHAEELHDLAHGLEGDASTLLHEAVSLLEQSNEKMAAALAVLKEG